MGYVLSYSITTPLTRKDVCTTVHHSFEPAKRYEVTTSLSLIEHNKTIPLMRQ